VSGTLAKTTAIGATSVFPAAISIPPDVDPHSLRLGMSGTATVFAKNACVIGLIASILIWVSAYTAYLSCNSISLVVRNRIRGLSGLASRE
jgi:hypothetical protein